MNYALGWFSLVTISLAISLVAFVWALKNGQFNEQNRLRYLPLRGEKFTLQEPPPARRPIEVKVLLGIGLVVCGVYLAAVVVAVI
jgi:nitrogen fixation-related uncharacterized protein